MHLHAVGRVQDEPPVAEFVAEALDHERRVVRHVSGRRALVAEEGQQVRHGAVVEAGGGHADPGVVVGRGVDLAHEGAGRAAELGGPTDAVALPERHASGLPERRADDHAVVRDLLDPPARGAEGEDVADAGLVDHLLVELADAGRLLADHEHAEHAAVGDRATARHRESLGAGTTGQGAVHAVPHQARAELGELVARVATGHQVERRLERRAGQGAERGAAADQLEPVLDVDGVDRPGRDGVLREDVERVRGHRDRLDLPGHHALDRHRAVHEVGAVLREEHPAGDLAHLVPGATDALQAAGDRRRGLDLHDEVDLAHVDAELERARRHHAAEPSGLQVVLDDRALVLRHGTVVRPGEDRHGGVGPAALGLPGLPDQLRRRALRLGDRCVRGGAPRGLRDRGPTGGHRDGGLRGREHPFLVDLVEPGGQAFGQPPGVREHDRRAVLLDEVDHPFLDVGPDRPVRRRLGRVGPDGRGAELGHVVHRHDDPQVERLLRRRRDDRDRCAAAEEARDLLRRTHRRGQADALHGLLEQVVEPLERDGEVRAALRRRDGVDLVHDDGVDVDQGLARARREHQVQRLGRRDEDVRRLAEQALPVGRGRVTAPDAHRHLGRLGAEPAGGLRDADERAAQVALDVHAERLERGDVEHAGALLGGRTVRRADEPVDRPEERRERLARPGRRDDQGVLPGGDRVPGAGLRGGRCGERAAEPLRGRGGEALEDVRHGPSHPARRHRQQTECDRPLDKPIGSDLSLLHRDTNGTDREPTSPPTGRSHHAPLVR